MTKTKSEKKNNSNSRKIQHIETLHESMDFNSPRIMILSKGTTEVVCETSCNSSVEQDIPPKFPLHVCTRPEPDLVELLV